jgi:hypothetical protein
MEVATLNAQRSTLNVQLRVVLVLDLVLAIPFERENES